MRRLLLLGCSLACATLAAMACSSGGGGGSPGIAGGSYVAANYRPGTDTCNLNQDPSGLLTDVFASAGNVTIASVGLTYLNNAASETHLAHFQRLPDPFAGVLPGAIFCTLSVAHSSTIAITGNNAFDVTETLNVTLQGGGQCADAGFSTLPCQSTETYRLTRQGAAIGTPTSTPAPQAVTGTLTASGSARLVPFADTTATSPSLTYSATLGGTTIPQAASTAWLCRAPDFVNASVFNYTAFLSSALTATSRFYLVVNTANWAAGSVSINPDTTVWAEVSSFDSAGNLVYDATASSGTLTLSSAGSLGAANPRCGFSLSAVPLSGQKLQVAPPPPLVGRIDRQVRSRGLKTVLW